ncbi:hypothetical protein ACU4IU_19085 [Brevibacterium sp. CSND-B09]|uniref:hypothetical protein n=1 Tax=Brevibacterium sp. CSND-B09 TaxID=3462571 RepID=UPI00406A82AD
MTTSKKTPAIAELEKLRKELGSINAVATHLGIPRSTVYNAFYREEANSTGAKRPGNEFMPWAVERHHLNGQTARMLRLYNRSKEHGVEVPEAIKPTFETHILTLEYNNFVVCYHRDSPPYRLVPEGGFFFRPRRADDTPGLLQQPAKDQSPPSPEQLEEWATRLR